jgi:O-acetyl-ADP-ribose deacetylase (regulator of RNase III)
MDITTFKVFLAVPEEDRDLATHLYREVPQVSVVTGDVMAIEADALLVPLNSFGFFDSGFPLRVADRFGIRLQDELRAIIAEKYDGELLVGQAEILTTGVAKPSFIVAAPLARAGPGDLRDTVNVYLATRGAMFAIQRAPALGIQSLAAPLTGVSEGRLTAYAAARQMRYGFRAVLRDAPRRVQNLSKALRRERELKRPCREEEGEAESG